MIEARIEVLAVVWCLHRPASSCASALSDPRTGGGPWDQHPRGSRDAARRQQHVLRRVEKDVRDAVTSLRLGLPAAAETSGRQVLP
jgi:hypothetical protein